MKQAQYVLLIAFLFAACGPTHVVVQSDAPPPTPIEAPEVSYQSFYDELSPYGQWIDYPGYGYVWMPSVGYGFRPYSTNGHWVPTDMGWTWASDYPWGWAAFHYGRWFFDNGYGWMWIPGQEWAPAWVSWRSSQEYYGWAPMGPNISFNTGYYNPPANYWCFVPHQYVSNPHMNNYYVNESRNVTIINNTTIINNYNTSSNLRNSYRGGPAADEVARYSGAPVRPVVVRENNRPGEQLNNNQFSIYRPRVSTVPAQNANGNRPAPARVQSLRDVRPTTRQNGEAMEPGNNNQPVNRNNGSTPAAVNNNNPNTTNSRPAVEPSRTTNPENNNNFNHPADVRPDNDNRNRNPQVQQPVNSRPVNPAPQNNTFNRQAPSTQNTAKPTQNNSNPPRTNTTTQNNNQSTINRPSTVHPAPQRTATPATNKTQKPQPKPEEKSARPEEKNK